MQKAIECGNEDAVRDLIHSGEDLDQELSPKSEPPLFLAIRLAGECATTNERKAFVKIARILIASGANIHFLYQQRTSLGKRKITPLYLAASYDVGEVIRPLLKSGADPEIRAEADDASAFLPYTPLQEALWKGNLRSSIPLIEGNPAAIHWEFQSAPLLLERTLKVRDVRGFKHLYQLAPPSFQVKMAEAMIARKDVKLLIGLIREGLPGEAFLESEDPWVREKVGQLWRCFMGGWFSLMTILGSQEDPKVIPS